MNKEVFVAFDNGCLSIPGKVVPFAELEWTKHATFEGVELKHIITGKATENQFSYHIVRIAPGMAIKNHVHESQLETHEVIAGSGKCINDGEELNYEVGVISIVPAKVPHEVVAGDEGLYLFAKFMPALC